MDRRRDRIFDEYLAAAARAGDARALGTLARRWEKRLVRHAYRLSGDIAQEAWIDIARGVPAGTVKTRLKAAREKLRAALGVTMEKEDEPA